MPGNLVYSWQTPAETGEGAMNIDPTNTVGLFYLSLPQQYMLPSTSSGSNTYRIGAQAPTAVCGSTCTYLNNSGAQTAILVVSQQVTGCLSYWISDDSVANIWGQVGYYICNGSTPVAFYQIWNLNTYAVLTTGTTSVSTGYHTFSMYSQSTGNLWTYALDGNVFGTYDMGASLSKGTYPVQAVNEEGYVSDPWNPAQVWFSTAIQTFQTANTFPVGNGWYSAPSAFESWAGCSSTGALNSTGSYSCWGIAGNLQDSSIPPDSMVTGGSTPFLSAGSYLWNGGTTNFNVTTSPTSVGIDAGVAGTSAVTIAPVNGFTGTVTLSSSVSPPSGLTCTLSPTSVTLGSSQTSTLSCSGGKGIYTVAVTGASGSLSHTATVMVTIQGFTPTITTVIKDSTGTIVTSVPVGTAVRDTATLSGGSATITGTVTYTLFGDDACTGTGTVVSTVNVGGNNVVPDSANVTIQPAGLYSFQATYNADANNNPSTSLCEPLTVLSGPSLFQLTVNTPSAGVLVVIDGANWKSDENGNVKVQVAYGTHSVFVQPTIPMWPGSAHVGLTRTFSSWDDGNTDNPRAIAVIADTVLKANYRVTTETSFYAMVAGAAAFSFTITSLILYRRNKRFQPIKGES